MNLPQQKKVYLIHDSEDRCRLAEKLWDGFAVQCSQVNFEFFYPPLVMAQSPDLIIFDIGNQQQNLVVRLEQLRRLIDDWGSDCPTIIVLCADCSEEVERLVRKTKVDFFLPRTGAEDSLEIALQQILG